MNLAAGSSIEHLVCNRRGFQTTMEDCMMDVNHHGDTKPNVSPYQSVPNPCVAAGRCVKEWYVVFGQQE